MSTTLTFTDREEFLHNVLACDLTIARYDQAEVIWQYAPFGPEPPFSLAEALRRGAAMIDIYEVNLHPPIYPLQNSTGPVKVFHPNRPLPNDFRPLSELLRARWSKPAAPTTVLVASRAAVNRYGADGGELPPLTHRDHDVLLADAFLWHLKKHPARIGDWVGERCHDKAGYKVKDPDAVLVGPAGPYRIIESGGRYSARQLASLCAHARERRLVLEIW